MSRDMVAAAQEILAGRLPLKGYPDSLAMPHTSAAFAADDPLPGLLDVPLVVPRLVRRLMPSQPACSGDANSLTQPFFQGERHGFRQTGGR